MKRLVVVVAAAALAPAGSAAAGAGGRGTTFPEQPPAPVQRCVAACVAVMAASAAVPATAQDSGDGTRARPYPLHALSPVRKTHGWYLRINKVVWNANQIILKESEQNHAPRPGKQYVLVNLTLAYRGQGRAAAINGLVFYAAARNNRTYDFQLDPCGLTPGLLDDLIKLGSGSSTTGNLCVTIDKRDLSTLLFLAEPAQLLPGTAQSYFRLRP